MEISIHKKSIFKSFGKHLITLEMSGIPRVGDTIYIPFDAHKKYKVKNVTHIINADKSVVILVSVK